MPRYVASLRSGSKDGSVMQQGAIQKADGTTVGHTGGGAVLMLTAADDQAARESAAVQMGVPVHRVKVERYGG